MHLIIPCKEQIVSSLRDIQSGIHGNCACELAPDMHEMECEAVIEIRLNVQEDDWEIKVGDPSYDTDHRGHWGASTIGRDDEDETLDMIADGLLDEIEGSLAESEED